MSFTNIDATNPIQYMIFTDPVYNGPMTHSTPSTLILLGILVGSLCLALCLYLASKWPRKP